MIPPSPELSIYGSNKKLLFIAWGAVLVNRTSCLALTILASVKLLLGIFIFIAGFVCWSTFKPSDCHYCVFTRDGGRDSV